MRMQDSKRLKSGESHMVTCVDWWLSSLTQALRSGRIQKQQHSQLKLGPAQLRYARFYGAVPVQTPICRHLTQAL